MADDAHVTNKHRHRERGDEDSFRDIAREELSVTARAFFAPVVGAVHVVRGLLVETKEPDPPKKPKAAA